MPPIVEPRRWRACQRRTVALPVLWQSQRWSNLLLSNLLWWRNPHRRAVLSIKGIKVFICFFLRPHQADLFIRRAGNLHLYNIVARNAAVPNIRIESIYRINDWSDLDIAKQSLGTFVEQIHYVGVWCDVEFSEDSFSENCHTDIEAIRHSGHVTGFDLLVLSTPPIAIVSFFSEARCDKQRRSAQQEKESFHIHCPVG